MLFARYPETNRRGKTSRRWDRANEEVTPDLWWALVQLGDNYSLVDFTVLESVTDPWSRIDIETHWEGSSSHRRFVTWVRHHVPGRVTIEEAGVHLDEGRALTGHGLCVAQWRREEHLIIRKVTAEQAAGERLFR